MARPRDVVRQDVLDRLVEKNDASQVAAALNTSAAAVQAFVATGRLEGTRDHFGRLRFSKLQVAKCFDGLADDDVSRIDGPPAEATLSGWIAQLDQVDALLRDRMVPVAMQSLAEVIDGPPPSDQLTDQQMVGGAVKASLSMAIALAVTEMIRSRNRSRDLIEEAQAAGVDRFEQHLPLSEALGDHVSPDVIREVTDCFDRLEALMAMHVDIMSAVREGDLVALAPAIERVIDYLRQNGLISDPDAA